MNAALVREQHATVNKSMHSALSADPIPAATTDHKRNINPKP